MSLARFHDAQADIDSGYEAALDEMRSGRKRRHWIWYVFPQLAGLGRSGVAQVPMASKTSTKLANIYEIPSCVPVTKKSLLPWPNN